MSAISDYRAALRQLTDWEPYLLAHSNLPGPRGNLELAHAVAHEGDAPHFLRWSALAPDAAPENTPEVFLVFCGVLGLGRLLAQGEADAGAADAGAADAGPSAGHAVRARLRALASDPRWRVREAVATALQLWGDVDMAALLAEMSSWATGNYTEQRAAAAGLCEPRLLREAESAAAVVSLLDAITRSLAAAPAADRKSDAFRTLRQGLGYCWSVAVAAQPDVGVPVLRRWLAHNDPDVQWVIRENLRKKRLAALQLSLSA